MGAFEVIGTYAKDPSTNVTATAAFTGQSLKVRAGSGTTQLLNMWASNATGGVARIKGPGFHDQVQGIRTRVAAGYHGMLIPWLKPEVLTPNETYEPAVTGGDDEVDLLFLLAYYQQLAGQEASVATAAEVLPRIKNIMGVEVPEIKGGTEGHWGAPIALNAIESLFKSRSEYAILGYLCDQATGAVALSQGPVGQLRIGGPGDVTSDMTYQYFVDLSAKSGEAAIPVFNAENVNQIQVEIATAIAEAERNITFVCAQLT